MFWISTSILFLNNIDRFHIQLIFWPQLQIDDVTDVFEIRRSWEGRKRYRVSGNNTSQYKEEWNSTCWKLTIHMYLYVIAMLKYWVVLLYNLWLRYYLMWENKELLGFVCFVCGINMPYCGIAYPAKHCRG